ncbi:hypothetical protein GCM10027341_56490 [Spirosoma knui]
MSSLFEEKEFEERSDYIDDANLEIWNVENEHFAFIQQKLLAVGAKLLAGPRGTGKTHQMKIAHFKCAKDVSKPLSIFVSFSKYYHLEPFLTKVPNAIQIFHTWVLAKVVLGCYSLIEEQNIEYEIFANDPHMNKEYMESFIEKAEKLKASQLNEDPLISRLSIAKVTNLIENITKSLNRSRAVIMLDDAALTLTPEYLIEFFDIVRSLKTKVISPKASVYPGTTQYGPRFHVGQDAEMVQCWLSIETSTYSSFMDSLIEKRFNQYKEGVSTEILELFKYASFGIPRAFISLLRNYKSSNERSTQAKYNSVIEQQTRFIESEYMSITQKLVQYKRVIEAGYSLFKKITEEIRDDNKGLNDQKNIVIGIPTDSISNFKLADRMLRFLIEAGLLYEEVSVKHGTQESTGEKREYKRYIPHILFLIQNRTFSQGHGSSFGEVLNRIKAKSRKQPLRRVINNLLPPDELSGLSLDLPPCQSCNTPRLSPEQRFCHNCGKELVNQSAFEECLKISVDDLPLTIWQKERVKGIQLNTVGDFMALQDPGTELRKVRLIGEYRSNLIYNEVLKTVDEFLA